LRDLPATWIANNSTLKLGRHTRTLWQTLMDWSRQSPEEKLLGRGGRVWGWYASNADGVPILQSLFFHAKTPPRKEVDLDLLGSLAVYIILALVGRRRETLMEDILSIFYYVDLVKSYTIDLLSINSLTSFLMSDGNVYSILPCI